MDHPMPEFDLDNVLMTPPEWWRVTEIAEQKASTTAFCTCGDGDWEPMVTFHPLRDTCIPAALRAGGEEPGVSLRGSFERIAGELCGELCLVQARDGTAVAPPVARTAGMESRLFHTVTACLCAGGTMPSKCGCELSSRTSTT